MRFRPATLDDAEMLLRWRNDLATRAASVDGGLVAFDQHVAWLTAACRSATRTLLIAEIDRPVGTVRVDRHHGHVELSWTVAPDCRGMGVGKEMVRAAMPEGRVLARIKRDNLGSQRIAAAAGFRLRDDGEVQIWERVA